jgi:XTP/dITP diphosphohydrolase
MMDRSNLEVLIATQNPGKIREIQDALRGLPLRLRSLDEFPDISKVAEVGETYRENAVLKALGYSKQTGLLALADDSGLEVEALGGMPGVRSARFGGEGLSDSERIRKLLVALSERPNKRRNARFVCCMALARLQAAASKTQYGNVEVLTLAEGVCDGVIAEKPRGANGFGYDPVFVPDGYDATFAELPGEVKRSISHRALALSAIREFFERYFDQT